MHVGGAQRPGHGAVGVHQPVSQASLHAGVHGGPGDGGSVQLETLRQQDRDVRAAMDRTGGLLLSTLTGRAAVRGSADDSMQWMMCSAEGPLKWTMQACRTGRVSPRAPSFLHCFESTNGDDLDHVSHALRLSALTDEGRVR